jgi:hypothetical protein
MRTNATEENGFNSFGRTGGEVIPLADRIAKGAKPKVAKRRAQSFSEIEIILVLGALGKSAKDLKTLTIKLLDGVRICPEKVSEVIDNLLRKFVNMRESFQAAHEAGLIENVDPAKKAKAKAKREAEKLQAKAKKNKEKIAAKLEKDKKTAKAKAEKDKVRENARQAKADAKIAKDVEKSQKAEKAKAKKAKAKKTPQKATKTAPKAKGKGKKAKKGKKKK